LLLLLTSLSYEGNRFKMSAARISSPSGNPDERRRISPYRYLQFPIRISCPKEKAFSSPDQVRGRLWQGNQVVARRRTGVPPRGASRSRLAAQAPARAEKNPFRTETREVLTF